MIMIFKRISFFCFLITTSAALHAQSLRDIVVDQWKVKSFYSDQSKVDYSLTLLSYEVNGVTYNADQSSLLTISFEPDRNFDPGFKGVIAFKNESKDTLRLSNIVPFGRSEKNVYITGLGNHRLSRTHLFLPHRKPVNIIVPDNAWELGYSGIRLNDTLSVFGFTRRVDSSLKNIKQKRFETILAPGGSVSYLFYADFYKGQWQEGTA